MIDREWFGLERIANLENFKQELDLRGFAITDHIVSQASTIIPHTEQPIPVSVTLPHGLTLLDIEELLAVTTRSKFAHLGAEVQRVTPHPTDRRQAIAYVANYALRPILLPEGEGFFSLYYVSPDAMITGEELSDFLQNSESGLRVNGQENIDWRTWRNPDGSETLEAIEFFIDHKSMRWIPPSNKPIKISSREAPNHSRSEIDKYLRQPVPKTEETIHYIAETKVNLHLDPSIHGILATEVYRNGEPLAKTRQIKSVIFLGGNTYGKSRLEFVGPTTEDQIPESVIMRFAKAN